MSLHRISVSIEVTHPMWMVYLWRSHRTQKLSSQSLLKFAEKNHSEDEGGYREYAEQSDRCCVFGGDNPGKWHEILEEKQKEYGTEIYLISDEPYRELAFDGVEVPYLTKYYKNTIVAYSYSKSLSLPGERIGYLVIPSEVADSGDVIAAAGVANRILGFVNAPTLLQKVVAKCIREKNRSYLLQ